MKILLRGLLCFCFFSSFSQNNIAKSSSKTINVFKKDTLIIVSSSREEKFYHPYILFIPKGTSKNKPLYLLIEPNNTGLVSDSIEVHKNSAIHLAGTSSIGNNISTELKIPLLVPIFPRPKSEPLIYTHALDRDVMLEKKNDLERLDLQLIAMISDAKGKLSELGLETKNKVFMNGFSASGTFVNRFLFIHPKIVAAAATGGLNGELMLPLKKYKERDFKYPLGIHDFKNITNTSFDWSTYQKIPQLIYMGALDTNDAVQFDDAYNSEERKIINATLGDNVQDRWRDCQRIYKELGVSAQFKTYANIGHWTTGAMNLATIMFFLNIHNN